MRQILDAIFENGTFRPLSNAALPLSPGQHVRLIVETRVEGGADVIELAAQVYEGLSDDQVDEIERITLDRREFFQDSPRS